MDKRVMPRFANRYVSRYFLRFLQRYGAQIDPRVRVLDAGSGRFRHARCLQQLGVRHITCVDKTRFQERPPRGVRFLQHDLERGIPIDDPHGFDLIICTQVMMFIRNREQLLDEFERVANDGAYLVLEINQRKLSFGMPIEMDSLVTHLLRHRSWQLLDLLRKQGKVGAILQKVSKARACGGLAPRVAVANCGLRRSLKGGCVW